MCLVRRKFHFARSGSPSGPTPPMPNAAPAVRLHITRVRRTLTLAAATDSRAVCRPRDNSRARPLAPALDLGHSSSAAGSFYHESLLQSKTRRLDNLSPPVRACCTGARSTCVTLKTLSRRKIMDAVSQKNNGNVRIEVNFWSEMYKKSSLARRTASRASNDDDGRRVPR